MQLERRENAVEVEDSNCVPIADMPTEKVGVIDEVFVNKDDDNYYFQVLVHKEEADTLECEEADSLKCKEADTLECEEEAVGIANTFDSFAQISNELKAEKMLSFSSIFNFLRTYFFGLLINLDKLSTS